MANRSGARGRLTVYGRQLLVRRVIEQGYPAARAADMQGVSRSCAYRWLRRYRTEGWAGLHDRPHLPGYLNDFVFRFNRHHSRSHGMVFYRVFELAVAHEPVRYRDLVHNPQPKATPPRPPGRRGQPSSLERPPANRPWRTDRPSQSG